MRGNQEESVSEVRKNAAAGDLRLPQSENKGTNRNRPPAGQGQVPLGHRETVLETYRPLSGVKKPIDHVEEQLGLCVKRSKLDAQEGTSGIHVRTKWRGEEGKFARGLGARKPDFKINQVPQGGKRDLISKGAYRKNR